MNLTGVSIFLGASSGLGGVARLVVKLWICSELYVSTKHTRCDVKKKLLTFWICTWTYGEGCRSVAACDYLNPIFKYSASLVCVFKNVRLKAISTVQLYL